MKRIIFGVSLLALSASAAWAQGTTTAPTTAPTTGQPTTTTTRPTYAQPSAQAAGPQADVPPYTAEVGPRQGDWEAFIGGSGTSDGEFNDNSVGVNGSIGYYALKWLPVSLRQAYVATFGDNVNDRNQFATTVGADFQAPLGRFQPFLGGFVGYTYGHTTSGLAGPEGGIKFYVNESTFIEGLFQYGWLFDKNLDWENGRAAYTIGVGFNF
jgi:hypothetical protein